MSWTQAANADLKRGDVLTGPFHGRMLALTVLATDEGPGHYNVELSGTGKITPNTIFGPILDLAQLPKGWRHLRGAKTLNKG